MVYHCSASIFLMDKRCSCMSSPLVTTCCSTRFVGMMGQQVQNKSVIRLCVVAHEVATYAAAPRPYAKSATARFHSIPVEQHGVVNVTYTVELPLVENFLVDECGLS